MGFAIVGSIALVIIMFLFLTFKPVPGAQVGLLANLGAALLVVIFGFLFVTVSSRIVGLIGSSANPISGMTIATLMATSAIFLVTDGRLLRSAHSPLPLAALSASHRPKQATTSQDLKTGYLLGATPIKQRFAFLIGITVSTLMIGFTLDVMNKGLQEFREAPRAGTSAHRILASPSSKTAWPDGSIRRERSELVNAPPQERVCSSERPRLFGAGRRKISLRAVNPPH